MPTRRHALALLATAPFVSSCARSDIPDPVAGWRDPGAAQADPRRFALAHAILAPNPHNTQPWLVEFDSTDGMTLYCDLDRRLPFTDPLDRQITMGCGAFLQLYVLAAQSLHFAPVIEFFPDGEPTPRLDARPLARVRLGLTTPVVNADPIFAHVTARRTNRNDYDASRPPNEDAFASIAAPIMETGEEYPGRLEWTSDLARVAQMRDLVWRAFDRELRTGGAQEETYQWLRFGKEERARHRDGLYIDVPMPGVLRAIGMLDKADVIDPESDANQRVAREWKNKADTAPAFMWLTSADDTPSTRLLAGMAYARMNLAATAAGVAMHPWSQALQEYSEMAELYAEARTLLGAGDQTLQMLVRVGYAEPVEPAARRDAADFVRA